MRFFNLILKQLLRIIVLPAVLASMAVVAQTDISQLEPGRLIERELKGGESHGYVIGMKQDQFLRVSVEQRGINVVVKLFGPDKSYVPFFSSTANAFQSLAGGALATLTGYDALGRVVSVQ